jgi:methionine sulfoxide reductase heme-binding subunit
VREHGVNDALWYLTRATGIVAAVLIAVAVISGFLFSGRETGRRRRPNWWLDLHNMLGGLALVFTIAHIVAALVDTDLGLALADVLVPGVAGLDRWPVAWGVIATYLAATAVLTSWPKKRFRRRTWRIVHLGSVLGFVLVLVHALQMGTDAATAWLRGGVVLVVAVAAYALGVRVFGLLLPAPATDSQQTLR